MKDAFLSRSCAWRPAGHIIKRTTVRCLPANYLEGTVSTLYRPSKEKKVACIYMEVYDSG